MRYFPGYCESCCRSFLMASDGPAAAPTCPRCDRPGRLIPGAYYAEGDRALFSAVESALHDARLVPAQVVALLALLEGLADQGTRSVAELRQVLRRIPGLHHVEALFADETLSFHRVLGLLFSLLVPILSRPSISSGVRSLDLVPNDRASGSD